MGRALLGALLGVTIAVLLMSTLLLGGAVWYLANPEAAKKSLPFLAQQKHEPAEATVPTPLIPAPQPQLVATPTPIRDGEVQSTGGVMAPTKLLLPTLMSAGNDLVFVTKLTQINAKSLKSRSASNNDSIAIVSATEIERENFTLLIETGDDQQRNFSLTPENGDAIGLVKEAQDLRPSKNLPHGKYGITFSDGAGRNLHVLKPMQVEVRKSGETVLIGDEVDADGPELELTFQLPADHPSYEFQVKQVPEDSAKSSVGTYDEVSKTAKITIKQSGKHTFKVFYKDGEDNTLASTDVTVEVKVKTPWDLVAEAVEFEHSSETFLRAIERDRIPLYSNKLTVRFDEGQEFQREIRLKEGSDTVQQKTVAATNPSVEFTDLESGERSFVLQDEWSQKNSGRINVAVPKLGIISEPKITHYATNRLTENPEAIPAAGESLSISGGYLRLQGSGSGGNRIELLIYKKSGENVFEFEDSIDAKVDANHYWETELSLPGLIERRIFAVGYGEDTHRYSGVLKVAGQPGLPNDASLTDIKVNDAEPKNGQFTSNATEVKITAKSNQEFADTLLVAFLNGETVGYAALTGTDHQLTISGLAPGKVNDVRIALVKGETQSEEEVLSIKVVSQGPSVVGVVPRNFGTAPNQYTLVVQFDRNNPLERANAEYENNYILISNRGLGTDVLRPETATLDENTNAVSLRFADKNADIYELRINAHRQNPSSIFEVDESETGTEADKKSGIVDIYGNPLGKTDNAPNGDDYEDVLDGTTGSTPGGQTSLPPQMALSDLTVEEPDLLTRHVGLPEVTGPPVDYKEFTEPRESTNGFNPSDKVVTRVARLYYNRDAHRVVQVINRRAKSYNAQNATMSRQLADQARLFAEQTVDRRRESERRAIASAQRARQAEKRAQEARQQLASTESRLTDLNQLIIRQQGQVDSLEAQINGSTPERPSSDTRPIQVRLEDAKVVLSQLQAQRDKLQSDTSLLQETFATANASVEAYREREIEEREYAEREQAKEDRAIDHQFRLETAAAAEDPDTYVPGKPNSDDPVAQVSISVIGEGLIQLRGPLKGVNMVRTMINQMDSPVGQVRIGVHTVQVNGEDGDKMEEAVGRIQRYVDHSRFLTSQSAQMLRKAVVLVASRKAESVNGICEEGIPVDIDLHGPIEGEIIGASHLELGAECPPNVVQPGTQAWRNLKYQDAFFGKDFMDELREMDSEFLKSGNKILSLHSMDTTSLASALFLLALASNETRLEILQEFQRMLECNLPVDEFEYFDASDSKLRYHFKKFQFMADNARFVSFRGFFTDQVIGDDTLNPAQREFIRLAQILKSRLVTEIELKQRIVERALIEERIGNYEKELRLAKKVEEQAQIALERVKQERQKQQGIALENMVKMIADVKSTITSTDISLRSSISGEVLDVIMENNSDRFRDKIGTIEKRDDQLIPLFFDGDTTYVKFVINSNRKLSELRHRDVCLKFVKKDGSPDTRATRSWKKIFKSQLQDLNKIVSYIDKFNLSQENETVIQNELELLRILNSEEVQKGGVKCSDGHEFNLGNIYISVYSHINLTDIFSQIESEVRSFENQAREIIRRLIVPDELGGAYEAWVIFKRDIDARLSDVSMRQNVLRSLEEVDKVFNQLLVSQATVELAIQRAKEVRRPLDHKKFLDMLIDETEEKFIELVEGTRAQTAVIDDYVKRIATSLEDDFNTQFYEPAFRNIRKQTYSCWAVDFGQIEHTTVLTNNRQFAKVLPQATMEFDLPKRELAITEAMQAAQAAYNDYGALIADPNFLALTKLYSGQPAASVFNNGGPTPLVRDVLPGLSSQTDEALLIQGAPRQPQFESQLEALIPDPAVYKFETGTGYEIRPVIQPDGQSVVFKFNYMYTTNIREPVRADEKHLGRVKRHFVNTDVQLSNYELREVSRYRVALKANRTSRGVPLLEDIPVAGALFRPLPQAESSLQQNVILAHSVIYPTLFDLMGLRWAPAVADVDVHRLQEEEFVYRNRMKSLKNEVYDYSSTQVDEFLRLPQGERRPDLYRPQEEIPWTHPNGYSGPGNNQEDSTLQEVPAIQNFNPGPGMSAPLLPVDPQTSNDQTLFVPPKLEQEPDAGRTVVPSSFSEGQLQSTPGPTLMAPPRTSHFSNSKTDLPARGSRPISAKNAIRRVSFTTSPKAKSIVTADLPTPRKSQPQKRWAFPLLNK